MSSKKIVHSQQFSGETITNHPNHPDTRFRFVKDIYCVTTLACIFFETNVVGSAAVFTPLDVPANLIQFVLVAAFISFPLLYLFAFIGHYSKMGCLVLGRITPVSHGSGYTMVMITILDALGGLIVAAEAAHYLFLSLSSNYPWTKCNPAWKKPNCIGTAEMASCAEKNCFKSTGQLSAYLYRVYDLKRLKGNEYGGEKVTGRLLSEADGNGALCLMACCFLLLVISDLDVSWNNNLTTMLYMYYLGTMVIVGMIASTEVENTHHVFSVFDFKLASFVDLKTWIITVFESMRSINIGTVATVLIGSYMPTASMADLQSFIIWLMVMFLYIVGETVTSIVRTALADNMGADYLKIMAHDPDIMFVIYPQMLGTLHFSPSITSLIYFSFIFIENLVRVKMLMGAVYHTIADAKPIIRLYSFYIRVFTCVLLLLLSLPVCLPSFYANYMWLLNIMESSLSFIVLSIVCSCIIYIYGAQTICDDHHFLYGNQPGIFLQATLLAVPVELIVVTVFLAFFIFRELTNSGDLLFYMLACFIVSLIPQFMGLLYISTYYLKRQNMAHLVKCEESWGDPNPNTRKERIIYLPRKETNYFRRIEMCKHECLRHNYVAVIVGRDEETMHNTGVRMMNSEARLFSNSQLGVTDNQ